MLKITAKEVEEIKAFLREQPEKEKNRSLTMKEALIEMSPEIRDLYKKGWSFEEIVELLEKNNLKVSTYSLKKVVTKRAKKAKQVALVKSSGESANISLPTASDLHGGPDKKSGKNNASHAGSFKVLEDSEVI